MEKYQRNIGLKAGEMTGDTPNAPSASPPGGFDKVQAKSPFSVHRSRLAAGSNCPQDFSPLWGKAGIGGTCG
ncbi:MAG: hypothetical protein Fur0018_10600 [Anaerolineales bacterium]